MLNSVNEQLIPFSIHLNINQNGLVVKAENDTIHAFINLFTIFWAFTVCKILWYAIHINKKIKIGSSEPTYQYNRDISTNKMKSTRIKQCYVTISEKR